MIRRITEPTNRGRICVMKKAEKIVENEISDKNITIEGSSEFSNLRKELIEMCQNSLNDFYLSFEKKFEQKFELMQMKMNEMSEQRKAPINDSIEKPIPRSIRKIESDEKMKMEIPHENENTLNPFYTTTEHDNMKRSSKIMQIHKTYENKKQIKFSFEESQRSFESKIDEALYEYKMKNKIKEQPPKLTKGG